MSFDQHDNPGDLLDLLEDEEGSVMIEMVIVSPVLIVALLAVLAAIPLARFQIAAEQQAGVQAWQIAAQEGKRTELMQGSVIRYSDEVSIDPGPILDAFRDPDDRTGNRRLNTAQFDWKGLTEGRLSLLDAFSKYSSLRNGIRLGSAGALLTSLPDGNRSYWSEIDNKVVAYGIAHYRPGYVSEMLGDLLKGRLPTRDRVLSLAVPPYESMGLEVKNFQSSAVRIGLPDSRGGDTIVFRNTEEFLPINRLGRLFEKEESASTHDLLPVTYSARSAIIFDPHSIYWGAKSRRLFRGERMTLLRNPAYLGGYTLQTMMSGNFLALTSLPPTVQDLYGGAGEESEIASGPTRPLPSKWLSGVRILLERFGTFFEQAQPLRKYDKGFGQQHDLEGKYFDPRTGGEWGTKVIPESVRLEEVEDESEIWDMIQ